MSVLRDLSLKSLFIYLILFLFCLIFIFTSTNQNPKRLKNIQLKNKSIKLNDCIDIENKSSRNLNENIELIEFCLNEFRYNKN